MRVRKRAKALDGPSSRPGVVSERSSIGPARDGSPLVSVVVPAYDAERWIGATLQSLRGQTYRNLEIIVVDDGSTDGTARIVAEHAVRDVRVTLISQRNGGVAAARNRAIADARGVYIAPTDADDLSAPTRIGQLVAALEAADERTAVAYSWSAFLDEEGQTMAMPLSPNFEKDVRHALYKSNFVANGSAALMRADAMRQVGGYDTTLRDNNAQGCEDWAMLLQLSEHFHFVRVPEYLMGYRQSRTNMSSNHLQMLRSFELVAAIHAERYPHASEALRESRKAARAAALETCVAHRQSATALRLASRFAMSSPRWTWQILLAGLRNGRVAQSGDPVFANMIDPSERRPFLISDPDAE